MNKPRFKDLPHCGGKTGWPWTEGSLLPQQRMPEAEHYPRISVVTPSYNQGSFLEETIRSVLLQGYPELEFIIIDGGSTDDSVDIIRKYERWITYWVSEPDKGQTYAIDKGIGKATGDIFAWLNSDDVYPPGVLQQVAAEFISNPEIDLVYGDCEMIDDIGNTFSRFNVRAGGLEELLGENFISQPSAFFSKNGLQEVGGLDCDLHYAMDYDLWIRMFLKGLRALYVPKVFSCFRYHNASKSGIKSVQFGYEWTRLLDKIDKSKVKMVLPALLRAYHQTFETIIDLERQKATDARTLRDAITRPLELWISHIDECLLHYVSVPRLLAENYYSIGSHYCLIGQLKKGRKYLGKALQMNNGFNSRGLLAWAMTFLGMASFGWYHHRHPNTSKVAKE